MIRQLRTEARIDGEVLPTKPGKIIVYKVVLDDGGVLQSIIARYQWKTVYPIGQIVHTAFPMFAFDNQKHAHAFANEFLDTNIIVYRAEVAEVLPVPRAIPFALDNATDMHWRLFWHDRAAWEQEYSDNANWFIPYGTVMVNGVTLIERVREEKE